MEYIYGYEEDRDPETLRRCEQAARWLKVSEDGTLVTAEKDGRVREIALIGSRDEILRRLHVQTGYSSG